MFYNGVLVTNFGFVVWINSFSSRVKYSSFRIFEISLLSIKKWFLSLEMGEREEEEIKLKLINFFFFYTARNRYLPSRRKRFFLAPHRIVINAPFARFVHLIAG